LALKLELESSDESKCLYVEAMINALAAHLLRRYSTCKVAIEETIRGLPVHKLNAITSFIHESIEQKLSLERLAEVVHMSPHYFASSFKQSTGYTPLQYVTKSRIERAKQLLARRELEIVAIAQEVGFQNQSHFTRVFHKYTAVTPKTYRDTL
jgi:AraC family transcriptional regulator